jgi:2-polyprenyl-3-methyl-5-hydroxy-6-metoxy-1,4-benzoquinol methylase
MTESESFVEVESYKRAAKIENAVWNYKGLAIHAIPQIHEHAGDIIRKALKKGSRILDLASGSGAMCLRLQDLGMEPTGCDLVAENFRLHSKVPFSIVNLNESLPAELHQKFDCVLALEIVEHLENPRHLLRQCFKALRPGGLLVLSTPNIEQPISLAQFVRSGQFRWFMPAHYKNDGHITPISLNVLDNALKEAGFAEAAFDSIIPVSFSGLSWWKMRLFALALRAAAGRRVHQGDILICRALRPALN